ncbi:MAG: molecular chaperone DnaK [Spirochaetales bacterium]|nr:molecular chaperone DnaK [Spirochaetales bacterium]
MSNIIGIDLGTTNSAAAFIDGSNAKVIPNKAGNTVTPSVVYFAEDGSVAVGEPAVNMKLAAPNRTVTGIKRKMGIDENVNVAGKKYSPQLISSYILKKLKNDAEDYLGQSIHDAVITVPAYFSDAQRQATVDAGKIAGLNVLRIINEPTAASLAYGLNDYTHQNIVVYDLGGGTFDVSVLELESGIFEVRATKGNNHLGGMDFNARLTDFIVCKYKEETGIDLTNDKLAMEKLDEAAERAKIALSEDESAKIEIPFITADEHGPRHLSCTLTRDDFEILIGDYIDQTMALTAEAIAEAGMQNDDIDKIILVGGSSQIPLVIQRLSQLIGDKIMSGINPLEVVARGAAIQAGIIAGEVKGMVLVDITPLSLGIEIDKGLFVPIIERGSPIPTEAKKIFTTVEDYQSSVEIHILQGERRMAKENTTLGTFTLTGIEAAPKGEVSIEVTFNIDINSIVSVSARDVKTGESKTVIVNTKTGLTDNEIRQIIEDSNIDGITPNNFIKMFDDAEEGRDIIRKIEHLLNNDNADNSLHADIEAAIIFFDKAVDERDFFAVEKYLGVLKDYLSELTISVQENIAKEEFVYR